MKRLRLKDVKLLSQKPQLGDFPCGPVVKNLPSKAEDMGSIPGQGTKIPHAAEKLSLQVITTEPMLHN